jgi:phosphoserine phosphatase RsbU/P
MKPEQIIQLAFSDLKPEHLRELTSAAVQNTYPPDMVLCHEGELEHTFYVVMEGKVKVTRRMEDGRDRLLATLGGGSFFGEMALIENKPRSGSVTTVETTTVLEFPEELFDSLLERSPSLGLAMVKKVSANLRASDQAAIADLSRKNAELAQAYADLQAAQAELVAKERLERELEIAGEVQRSLLPSEFPVVPGYSFAGRNVPARTVGGDLYDVLPLDAEHVGLLMADVSDKGVHASLFMAVTRALFVALAKRSLSARDVTLNVHKALLEVSPSSEMFVTVFYGVLHGPTGRLTYVRAGQDRPLLFRATGGAPQHIDAAGRFLGMLEELELEERTTQLLPGDTLVMYSDGVPDAINPASEPYGLERLVAFLEKHCYEPPDLLCKSVFRDVFDFRGDAPAFDDITVLIAKAAGAA